MQHTHTQPTVAGARNKPPPLLTLNRQLTPSVPQRQPTHTHQGVFTPRGPPLGPSDQPLSMRRPHGHTATHNPLIMGSAVRFNLLSHSLENPRSAYTPDQHKHVICISVKLGQLFIVFLDATYILYVTIYVLSLAAIGSYLEATYNIPQLIAGRSCGVLFIP